MQHGRLLLLTTDETLWDAAPTRLSKYNGLKMNLSMVFAGQNAGVRRVSDRIGLVTFKQYDLGYFDDETCRLEPRYRSRRASGARLTRLRGTAAPSPAV